MARTLSLTLLLAAVGCSQTPPPVAKPADKPPEKPAAKPAEPAKTEAAPEKSKYSLAQYGKLKIGMTEDEVKAVLGEPTSKFEATKWRYAEAAGADAHVIYVDFEGGKVANKGASGFVAIDGTKLTKENVAKIKIGMTEAEVVALLGPGNPSETGQNTVLSYTLGEKRVPIVFSEGKVAAEPQPVGFD